MTFTASRVRRFSIWLCLAVAAGATIGVVDASAASSVPQVKGTQVSGSGVRAPSSATDVPFTFSFDAIANPASTNGIYGTFSGTFPHDALFSAPGDFASFQGVVTCLQVTGDQATIGGVVTSGYGYDDFYTNGQNDLTGDWFITTVQDPADAAGGQSTDTMGYLDWGDRGYFASVGYATFGSLCANPIPDLTTAQFPLSSGDIKSSD